MTTSPVLPVSEEKLQANSATAVTPSVRAAPVVSYWDQALSLARYLTQTEVHTYAFSVAANAILSLCPFIVMMFTVARQVFHSRAMENVLMIIALRAYSGARP